MSRAMEAWNTSTCVLSLFNFSSKNPLCSPQDIILGLFWRGFQERVKQSVYSAWHNVSCSTRCGFSCRTCLYLSLDPALSPSHVFGSASENDDEWITKEALSAKALYICPSIFGGGMSQSGENNSDIQRKSPHDGDKPGDHLPLFPGKIEPAERRDRCERNAMMSELHPIPSPMLPWAFQHHIIMPTTD